MAKVMIIKGYYAGTTGLIEGRIRDKDSHTVIFDKAVYNSQGKLVKQSDFVYSSLQTVK